MSVRDVVQAAAGALGESTYIEDVFSTWLYTGNGSTQTITNGIDLSGEGGMVWIGRRDTTNFNVVTDTARGANLSINTYSTAAQTSPALNWTFNSNGFSQNNSFGGWNASGASYCAWTFRKAEKFFDVVTYTGNGTAGRTVAHNLGSEPGFIIVKRTNSADEWFCYHRSLSANNVIYLNLTNATNSAPNMWNNTAPTSTVFSLGTDTGVNANGGTYVAYLFAHDAGGFGASGSDNVISCGSFTHNGTSTTVNLGYEPQWFIIKRTDAAAEWELTDTMRSASATGKFTYLFPSASFAETTNTRGNIAATGLSLNSGLSAGTYIYVAIRRGPMKTPESGTSVFAPVVYAGNGTTQDITTGFANDMEIIRRRGSAENNVIEDKLRGKEVLFTNTTDAGLASTGDVTGYLNTGFTLGASNQGSTNDGGSPSYISWNFRRAPGFFDEVCYTGDGSNPKTITHNLAAVPELMIVKRRNNTGSWLVYSAGIGATNYLVLNATDASTAGGVFNNATPTSSSFQVYGTSLNTNGGTYVAYLFATCPGVSKVGSYTGTAATQQINCGFTGGARFVLIKRTDSTGDWYVWDSARGIVAGNDPYLLLNSTAAEVTNTDYVDTYSAGFEISSTAPAGINANGGSFIFLAIA